MPKLRVISGSAKGRRLNLVPGDITRPITDRVKEALFNILRADLPGCHFLDLFAGTGSVGIEALSRGADHVRIIDSHKLAIKTLKENLELTKLGENAEVVQGDAFVMLSRSPNDAFDYIYIAPPQYKGMWKKALSSLDKNPDWLVEDGWAIAQIDPKEYEPLTLSNLSEFDQRKYGSTLLVFYEREP
jgi:16S rRNA (guanine(966)-N(2))-methyltransferase RsmD